MARGHEILEEEIMQYYCAQCGRLFNTVRVRKYCDECRELAKRICNNMYSMGYCRNRRDKEREMSIYATNDCISGLMDQLSELTKKRDALKAEIERLRADAALGRAVRDIPIRTQINRGVEKWWIWRHGMKSLGVHDTVEAAMRAAGLMQEKARIKQGDQE